MATSYSGRSRGVTTGARSRWGFNIMQASQLGYMDNGIMETRSQSAVLGFYEKQPQDEGCAEWLYTVLYPADTSPLEEP